MAYETPQTASPEEARLDSGLSPIPQPEAQATTDDSLIDYGDVKVRPSDVERLSLFLDQEIQAFDNGTQQFQSDLRDWRECMDPKKRTKDFPWKNAANFFMPIGRIVVDSIKSTVKETVDRKNKKLFVAEILSPADVGLEEGQIHDAEMAVVELCEKFAREPGYLDLSAVLDEALDEMPVSGLAAFKLTNDTDVRNLVVATGRDENGIATRDTQRVVFHTGPRIDVTPTETFFFPLGQYKSVADMPYVGNWLTMTPAMLENRALPPYNYKYTAECARVGASSLESMNLVTAKRQDAIGQTGFVSEVKIYEVFIRGWRLYKDSNDLYALRVTYCPASRYVLKIALTDASYPYELEYYSKRAGTIVPRGGIEHIVQCIAAINTGINQTFDAQTLANSPSITYPEESQAQDKLENGYFPGLQLPSPEKGSIDVLKFPDASALSLEMLGFFQNYIQQLTRIGPSVLGDLSAGRRTPATLGLSMQQASNQLIDELIDRLRLTIGRLMGRSFVMYYQDDPNIFDELLGPEKGGLVRTIVQTSLEKRRSVAEIVRLRLSGSSAARSIELERQNLLAVTQLSMAWTKMAVELMTLLFSPEAAMVPVEGKQAVIALLKAQEVQLRRVVELSDIPDAASVVPKIAEMIEGVVTQPPQQPGMMGPEAMMAGGGGGGPLGAIPNLSALLQGGMSGAPAI